MALEPNRLLFHSEMTQGLVLKPSRIRDGSQEQNLSNGYLILGFMGLSGFYFWFRFFLILTLFILICFAEQLVYITLFEDNWEKSETSLETSKKILANRQQAVN